MRKSKHEILEFADQIEQAEVIEVASGDREPPSRVTKQGQKWIVEGLKLLAKD